MNTRHKCSHKENIPPKHHSKPPFLPSPAQKLLSNHQLSEYEAGICKYIYSLDASMGVGQTNRKTRIKLYRVELVRYMYKVHRKYKLKRTTLYLASYYLDKYLQILRVAPHEDRLLAITQACLLIAMKYEEIYPPSMQKWAKQDEEEIIAAEGQIVTALQFRLNYTTAQQYLDYLALSQQLSPSLNKACEAALDVHLFTGELHGIHPQFLVSSIIAAVANHEQNRAHALLQRNTGLLQNLSVRFHEQMDK